MINISINIGPAVVWASLIFVTFWLLWAAFLLGQIRERVANTAAVQRRAHQLLIAPWHKPGPPLQIKRVDPKLGIIFRRYGGEDEEEEAAA